MEAPLWSQERVTDALNLARCKNSCLCRITFTKLMRKITLISEFFVIHLSMRNMLTIYLSRYKINEIWSGTIGHHIMGFYE